LTTQEDINKSQSRKEESYNRDYYSNRNKYGGYYYTQSDNKEQSYRNQYYSEYSYAGSDNHREFRDFYRTRTTTKDKYSSRNSQYYQYRNSHTYDESFSSKDGKFHIYKDPYTGKYYKVYTGSNSEYDARKKYKNPYDEIYNNNPYSGDFYEEEVKVEVRHLVAIFTTILVGIIYFMNLSNKKKAWDQQAIVYKNQVYYPKNKDPILDHMVKNKGHRYPRELYDKRGE
jgi:hypothetical protein